jgi:hypothetical protein
VPSRFRCQPDLALQGITDPVLLAIERARITPVFTSMSYGQAPYAQLDQSCAAEIRGGADDGSEMGVFGFLKQPQREKNLQSGLDEYLRFGLEAGTYFVT